MPRLSPAAPSSVNRTIAKAFRRNNLSRRCGSAMRRTLIPMPKRRSGLLEIEWAILGGQSGETAGGHGLLRAWSSAEIRHHERCRNQARDSVVCRTGIRSRAFGLARAFVAYSVIQMCGSSRSIGAQKNDLQLLRSRPDGLVRSAATAGSRSVERRVPDRSGVGGAAHRVRRLRLREARAAGFSGGQSSLHQALCLLCRASLPAGRDPRCRQGAEARLGNSQDTRDAVHAGADRTGGRDGTQGDRRRRDRDSQGPRLSHRGQRSGAQEADLVRRRRPFRGEHGAVLRLAGATEVRQNQARRDGHPETVPQRREGKAPQAAILFDKFHILRHLGEALDKVRKAEYARLGGKDRRFIKGQKYTLLSRRENLTLEGKRSLQLLLAANKRLNTACVLKESFGQLWDYQRESWARRFFDNWRASLKWQRLKPYERFADMIDRHWDGIAAYCKPENKVSLGFVEGNNNKIRVFQRRAYGLKDEEYLRLKVLSCMLPPL